jgi:hypothetical protein
MAKHDFHKEYKTMCFTSLSQWDCIFIIYMFIFILICLFYDYTSLISATVFHI